MAIIVGSYPSLDHKPLLLHTVIQSCMYIPSIVFRVKKKVGADNSNTNGDYNHDDVDK